MRGLFEREWIESDMQMKAYFLDITEHPGLSEKVESEFNVKHASPQILIIEKQKCIFSATHGGVDVKKIRGFSNLRDHKFK
jgi:bacillithiol system protein YtxJ